MDFWTSFFANLPATILALGTLLGVIRNWRKTDQVAEHVKRIENNTDGLVEASNAASKAEGVVQGKIEERANPTPRNPYLGGA